MSRKIGTRALNPEAFGRIASSNRDWHDWTDICCTLDYDFFDDYSLLHCNEKRYEETDRFASLIRISFIPSIDTEALIVAIHHVSDRFSTKGILDQARGYSTTGTDKAVFP